MWSVLTAGEPTMSPLIVNLAFVKQVCSVILALTWQVNVLAGVIPALVCSVSEDRTPFCWLNSKPAS